MTQGDPSSGGFLSKVARFVRHPTVDWSELEARTAGVDEERAALKAALQRRRRNDRVRHRELNDLRELMTRLRESTPQTSTQGGSSILTVPPSSGNSDKSRTIEQIARIEEQMSSNWQPRPPSPGAEGASTGLTIPARLDGGASVAAHLRTGRHSSTTFPMTIDLVTEDPHGGAAEWDAALSHPLIAEAAVRFANGQAGDAQKALRGLMAQEGMSAAGRAATVVMLDVLHATGDLEGFEELAAEYAERFGVPVPLWPVRQGAGGGSEPAAASARAAGDAGVAVWTCPMLLDEGAVQALDRLTVRGRGPTWLDWTHLVSADAASAQALLTLTQRWLDEPLEFRMRGAAVLRRRLKASTPSGRDENDRVWWQLRLALLRLMRRRDEFDLAALDFCVTYGVLPPDWQEPACRFQVAEDLPDPPSAHAEVESRALAEEPIQPLSTQLAGLDVHEWPAMVTTMADMDGAAAEADPAVWTNTLPGRVARAALEGRLAGDVAPALAALDQRLAAHPAGEPLRIDCSALQSVDFAAAGSLLQWFMAASGRGVKVELDGVSTLIGAFFHVVGIDEAVTVRLRQY